MKPPLISVIIPTLDRPAELGACLDSLGRLDWPRGTFETIVVDDGGSAPVGDVVDRFKDMLDVKLVAQKNTGPAGARNTGARAARGKLLAFIDDDCIADPAWLKAFSEAAQKHPDAIIGGMVENAYPENPYSSASQLITEYLIRYFNDKRPGGQGGRELLFFTTNNMAINAKAFRALGGFDASLLTAEDRDICLRHRATGADESLVYEPSARVLHAHRTTFIGFCRRHFEYGRGARYFHDKRKKISGEASVEPISFYARMFAYPFGREAGLRALSSTLLLVVSQALYLSGFLLERLCFGRRGR
jgi:GT2 family glycosyltransferase